MSPAGGAAGDGRELHIDRLTLRVSGLEEGAARQLALLIAEGLAAEDLTNAEATGGDLGRVRIKLTADAAEQGRPGLLAGRIAGELGRILGRGQGGEAAR